MATILNQLKNELMQGLSFDLKNVRNVTNPEDERIWPNNEMGFTVYAFNKNPITLINLEGRIIPFKEYLEFEAIPFSIDKLEQDTETQISDEIIAVSRKEKLILVKDIPRDAIAFIEASANPDLTSLKCKDVGWLEYKLEF